VKKVSADVAKIGIISLVSAADTAGAGPMGAPPGLGLRRDGGMSGAAGGGDAAAQPKARSGLLAAALELSGAAYAAPLVAVAAGNQKLLLLAAFLEVSASLVC
jgi:hypothetical protein